MISKAHNLIWIDLEMTGLDTERDYILEIATIVTDSDLNVIAEGPSLAISQSEEVLAEMDDWNTKQHRRSGLVERVLSSSISEAQAEEMTLAFVSQYVPAKKSPMCGSSICQDRRFLYRCMPKLEQYFHYRHVDVSTVKELAVRWSPSVAKGFKKKSRHLALNDIHDSIAELRYYREHMFSLPG
jgi:oligoribonuclease